MAVERTTLGGERESTKRAGEEKMGCCSLLRPSRWSMVLTLLPRPCIFVSLSFSFSLDLSRSPFHALSVIYVNAKSQLGCLYTRYKKVFSQRHELSFLPARESCGADPRMIRASRPPGLNIRDRLFCILPYFVRLLKSPRCIPAN